MNKQTFQTVRSNAANQQQPLLRKPLTGFYVSTTATGSSAASTDIVRSGGKSA